jgi:hypothetical protein
MKILHCLSDDNQYYQITILDISKFLQTERKIIIFLLSISRIVNLIFSLYTYQRKKDILKRTFTEILHRNNWHISNIETRDNLFSSYSKSLKLISLSFLKIIFSCSQIDIFLQNFVDIFVPISSTRNHHPRYSYPPLYLWLRLIFTHAENMIMSFRYFHSSPTSCFSLVLTH